MINRFNISKIPLKLVPIISNVGLGKALAIGLLECKHDLVARMDSDDISKPNRFFKQVNFFKQNLNIDVISSWVEEFIDDNGTDYYFMNGKPTGTDGETVDWDIGTPAVYLANLYYSMGESKASCELLLEYELSCDILDCEDFYFEDLIECIDDQNPF